MRVEILWPTAAEASIEQSQSAEPLPGLMMEKEEFLSLYQRCAPRLLGFIRRSCGNAALADDILQDTFCRLLRASIPRLEERQMTAYLYRTATSILTDHWRRVHRERRWAKLFLLEREPRGEISTGGDVMRFFRALKPQEQALLWLAYVEGFDHAEIAAALGLREASVRVLLFRARKRLAGTLAEAGLGPAVVAGRE